MLYEPSKQLDPKAPNFKMYEVGKSSTADRYRIDNTPTPDVLDRAALLAVNCLQPIRNHFGSFTAQSWYRGEALEKEIAREGFKSWCVKHKKPQTDPKSWDEYFALKSHPKGEAADIEIVGVSNDVLYDWCLKNLVFDQLIREFPKAGDPHSGWVHISFSGKLNRHQAFTIG